MTSRSHTEVMHTNVSALGQIVQSPYEGNKSAEVGEQLFEFTLSMMDPERGLSSAFHKGRKGPSEEAIEIFGERQAETILETNHYITSSGILYGCGWTEGTIQGSRCGPLKKELLLLCLRDHRIARSCAPEIKNVIKDLGLWKMISDVLSLWKLEAQYPHLARCNNVHAFKKKQTQCFKCILFIARTAISMKYLEWDFRVISDKTSLKAKIHACFGILENLVTVKQKKKAPPVADVGILCSTIGQCLDNINDSSDHPESVSIGPADLPLHHMMYNDETESTFRNHGSDLTRRLRSKDSKIVGIHFHSESGKEGRTFDSTTEHNVTQIPKLLRSISNEISNKKRNFNELSSTNLPKKKNKTLSHALFDKKPIDLPKNKKKTLSHALFDMKNIVNQNLIGRRFASVSRKDDGGKPGSLHTNPEFSFPDKKATRFSHSLFDTKNSSSQKTERKFVDAPKSNALAANHDSPSYVSDGSMYSSYGDPNFWYPVDSEELILNSLQIETAWLVEESMYCSRNTNVDWVYVMKYASPALKIELRQIPDVGGNIDEETLSKLFHNGIEAKRSLILRREVRRKLLKNVVRNRMKNILPRLRKATHPLHLKKMRLKEMAAVAAARSNTCGDIIV